MKLLLDNILHVSHDTFIKQIEKQVNKVITYYTNERPIFFYFYQSQDNKSNYYVYTYIKKSLEEKNIVTETVENINDPKLQENDIILFVDDCIYSGLQMEQNIERFLVDFESHEDYVNYIDSEDYKANKVKNIKKNKNIKLLLVVPYISEESLQNINSIFERRKSRLESTNIEFIVIDHIKIDRADKYLNEIYYKVSNINIDTIFEYYPGMTFIDFKPYLIYFDHKVSDNASTFPYIFNGLVPNKKNKQIILKIKELNSELQWSEGDILSYPRIIQNFEELI